jgi:TPR repeat protein
MQSIPMRLGLFVWVVILCDLWANLTAAQHAPSSKEQVAVLLGKANSGDVETEWRLGLAYEQLQDYAQAADWYRKAAERGNTFAEDHLAYLYDYGYGVPQDYSQAASWLEKAAEQGDSWAQTNLGTLLSEGHGVPQNARLAVLWWRKAAAQGDKDARKLLADAGEPVPKYSPTPGQVDPLDDPLSKVLGRKLDPVACGSPAVLWRPLAEKGYAFAQLCLGHLYEDGEGVPQDYQQAAFWYGKAATQGDADAQSALGQLESKLAAIRAEQKTQRDRIAISALCLVFLGAVTFAAIRLRQKLIAYGRRLLPHNFRSRQLAVLLLTGGWCSACCLIQVLNRRAMLHPVNAAVTALLWAIPGLICGAVCMWWLLHPSLNSESVRFLERPEPAETPIKRTPENETSTDAIDWSAQPALALSATLPYSWGKFQGWALLIGGVFAFFVMVGRGDIFGIVSASLSALIGYGLIRKERWGHVLFFIGAGIAAVIALFVGLLAILALSSGSENASKTIAEAFALSTVNVLWWIVPAIFYYPKRRREFSRNPSSVMPVEG